MKSDLVEIVLPTYNGEKYLKRLLDSLVSQSYKNISLITYDDGSKDQSIQIVDSYSDRIKITRIQNNENKNIGVIRGFSLLLSKTESDTIMLCDQDDIWMKDKVFESKLALDRLKIKYGRMPLLVFSDLKVIDELGETITDSFINYNCFNLNCLYDIYYLCFKNPAPGCSMVFNRKLLEKYFPVGSDAIMHDWWLIVNAAINGKVDFLRKPLIGYRKHSCNTMGPQKDDPNPVFLSILTMFSLSKFKALKKLHLMLIKQGKQIFEFNGMKFSTVKYFIKLFEGRYLFPILSKLNQEWKKKSWRQAS